MSTPVELLVEFDIPSPVHRATVCKENGENGLLLVHSQAADMQPSESHIRIPHEDTLKISAFGAEGEHRWTHDVGNGVLPGRWMCPVFPFDLDGDGVDEVYHVGNSSRPHYPLDKDAMELTALCGQTGEVLRSCEWPRFPGNQTIVDTLRYQINGGCSGSNRWLVAFQGTYHEIVVHARDENLNLLWERHIPGNFLHTDRPEPGKWPGCRASHMFSALDVDGDGRDEVFVGERCMDIDTGEDIWVADLEGYHGHSDIVMPTLNKETGKWQLYTTREFDWPEGSRGVVMFDNQGRELWGHRGMTHMHDGWSARLNDDGSHLLYAYTAVKGIRSYMYDMDGNPVEVPYDPIASQPVDVDGDGCHELVYNGAHVSVRAGYKSRGGLVIDRHGNTLAQLKGEPGHLLRSKLLDCPGEQIMTHEDGKIRIYGCPGATDSEAAKERYAHPYYASCQRMTAVGYNWRNLGGL